MVRLGSQVLAWASVPECPPSGVGLDSGGGRLILGRRRLEHVLRIYRQHYNAHKTTPCSTPQHTRRSRPNPARSHARLRRRDLLGGLIHEYEAA